MQVLHAGIIDVRHLGGLGGGGEQEGGGGERGGHEGARGATVREVGVGDADSIRLLSDVCTFLEDHGWTVRHVDCTLICEAPKMAPHRDDIRRSLARCIGLKPIDVNVKFTTNEGMGFVGRGEGMAALAVASVERAD